MTNPVGVCVCTEQEKSLDTYTSVSIPIKVTGYSCARRVKCIGKCILKLANQ